MSMLWLPHSSISDFTPVDTVDTALKVPWNAETKKRFLLLPFSLSVDSDQISTICAQIIRDGSIFSIHRYVHTYVHTSDMHILYLFHSNLSRRSFLQRIKLYETLFLAITRVIWRKLFSVSFSSSFISSTTWIVVTQVVWCE